jgi:hypothetical protein
MVAPCAVALAAAADHSRYWRESGRLVRTGATAGLCVAIIVAGGVWPTALWRTYTRQHASLGLPGTKLIRVEPGIAAGVQGISRLLLENCDTFYGLPNQNSFFIFTGLPAVSGMLANGGPAGLTDDQQRQVVDALARAEADGKRVCVLRNGTIPSPPPGPLTDALSLYGAVVAASGPYTISRHV